MNLLILTQKIDINDDLLGFFHGWVAALAKRFEKITVVALGVGQYNLPDNVRVLSLGKGNLGFGIWDLGFLKKLKYSFNFFRYIWRERKNYDSVLVHMNQEYVILGGIWWRLAGKKVTLWRNHKIGGFWVRVAVFLSDVVFCTSQFAFVARYKKTKLMPVGIDTDIFKFNSETVRRTPNSLLFFGRISPIKKPDILIDALNLLKKDGIDFRSSIIGDAPVRDKVYGEKIKQQIKKYGLAGLVKLERGVSNRQAPAIYSQHEVFINLTPAGSLDKMIFEAMACGCLVLLSNQSLAGQVDDRLFFKEDDPADLADKIKSLLALDDSARLSLIGALRNLVVQRHSLKILVERLFQELQLPLLR